MALDVGKSFSNLHLYNARREKLTAEKEISSEHKAQQEALSDGQTQPLDDESGEALLQRFSQATDEMSAAVTLFRNRKEVAKKAGGGEETSFDRVLDEEIEPKFDKLVKILKGQEGANIEYLLRHARSLFPDDSDLVLVLRETLRRRDLDEIVRKRLKTLLSQVEKEADPKRLKAGINVGIKARIFGKVLQMKPAIMRESYRGFIASEESEITLYQQWISTYGIDKRAVIIDFMEDALIADIDSADPSCSNREFGYLLAKIGQIKTIRSCEILFIQGLLKDKSFSEINVREGEWLIFLFCALQSEDELDILLFQVLGDYLKFAKRKERSKILQRIYLYLKRIPHDLFISPEDREELFSTFEVLIGKAHHHETIEYRKEKEG